ncbi:MAG: response regulator [Thiogranum sp.]
MKTTKIIYALLLVLVSIFLMSLAWEFGLEDRILPLLTDEYEPEPHYERWEYVISATVFAALALVLPALLLIKSASHLRKLNDELEARVKQRTRELRYQLDERLRIEQSLRKEVSDRKLAESLSARMGRIVENAIDEVYVLDAENLCYLQVNRRGRDNLGFTMDQLQTRSCADLVPGWTRESLEEMLRPLREGALEELVFEAGHQRKDGSQYDIECRVQFMPEEQPPVFVIMLQDITARKQMEAQIVEARDKAQVASAAKTLFLANISHELRTPMSAVIGMSDVLGRTPLSAEQQHYVTTIHKSGTAFLDIINGLLDLSMIESGKFTPREREFELHALVEAMLDMLAYRACQRGLELLALVDEEVPAWLLGDALALRQILLNLLGNAIKFTDYGVVDLRVSVVARFPQHCRLRFAVRDTGPGMSAERQAELFQPYTHAAASPRRHAGGVGLGLSICKSLVESMQGTIGVESVPGEGSLFWCEVEFAIGTVADGETATRHPLAGRRGLVVDDHPLARSILQSQLETLGVRVDAVGAATEALEVLRRAVADGDPCAFALVDVDMPGVDGLSLAYAIKSDQALAATHLVLLTSVDAPITGKTQQRVGFELQCAKPIRQSQLPDILQTLMHGPQTVDEGELISSAAADVRARPLRVLVVEDQPVNQELMQLMLRPLGCEVSLTSSAEEALDLLDVRAQDVVFMDCLMPGMDGYAATAAIRQREPDDRHVVIIAMTAMVVQGERQRCLAAGMDDFLSKPISEAILRQTLKRWFPGADLREGKSAGSAIADGDAGAAFRQMQAAGPELMTRLVDLFLDNTADSLDAMHEALEKGDKHELAKLAHALKGSCLQLGIIRMADLSSRLEDTGRSGDRAAALVQLSEAFEQARSELVALKDGAMSV